MENDLLPSKYVKLARDLAYAHETALAETANEDDGGTCNFDAPTLRLPRWNKAHVQTAAQMAGVGCFQWTGWSKPEWVICPRVPAQANRRTKCAERMHELLLELGYDSGMYYQMD